MTELNQTDQSFLHNSESDNTFHCSLSSQIDATILTELISKLGELGYPVSLLVESIGLLNKICTEDGVQVPKNKNNGDYYDDLEIIYQIVDPVTAKWQLVDNTDESSWVYVEELNSNALKYLVDQNMGANGRFILIGGKLSAEKIQKFSIILNQEDFASALSENAEFILQENAFSLWSRMPDIMDFQQFYFISSDPEILKKFEDIFPPYTVMHSFLLE